MAQKTNPGPLQPPMTGPINNPASAAAQALLQNPGAAQALINNPGAVAQALINNPGAAAQALLNNPGATHQPVLNNPGVGQQLISNPGANQPHISTPGANQAFINKPSTAQALMMSPSDSRALIRGDRGGMLSMSDDNVMMKQILTTHAPDGREVDVRPLLYLVEDILNRATQHVDFIVKV